MIRDLKVKCKNQEYSRKNLKKKESWVSMVRKRVPRFEFKIIIHKRKILNRGLYYNEKLFLCE